MFEMRLKTHNGLYLTIRDLPVNADSASFYCYFSTSSLFCSTANQPLTEAQLPQSFKPQGKDEASTSPTPSPNGLFVRLRCSVCAVLPADFGHGLVGLVGSEPEPDLQGVHADRELATDTLQTRVGVALQGKASVLNHSLTRPNPFQTHLQCVFDLWLVPCREVKASWEFCSLPTFTSATCRPGNTHTRGKQSPFMPTQATQNVTFDSLQTVLLTFSGLMSASQQAVPKNTIIAQTGVIRQLQSEQQLVGFQAGKVPQNQGWNQNQKETPAYM